MRAASRFAPTTSGPAHAGTLVAGLLAWLDARSRGASFLLRLEDVDRERCTPAFADEMLAALRWLGLDWDALSLQSEQRAAHEAALDRLAAAGALYPCSCSRSQISRGGTRAADGGWRYTGACRERALPARGWRGADATLRLRLPPGRVEVQDESGLELSQDPLLVMGDPVLLRRDGSVAYHLAVVVDDGAAGISRVVRGRDLATSTAIHVVLQRLLGLPTPVYRHHALLLEPAGGKLAKLHGSVGWRELASSYSAERFVGLVAFWLGLAESERETSARELVAGFDWESVGDGDLVAEWDGETLRLEPAPDFARV